MIGTKIGQYRVLQLLGEGGMGRVLLAEHVLMKTRHAIKILHDQLSKNETIVQRFINEARATGAIGHRNVIEITDIDQVEGGGPWYLVMKYLEGQTLTRFLESRKAPLEQRLIVHITGEALNGLQAAHDRQIIHRDLKPDNLYLTAVKGDPYRTILLDFGVAQLGQDAGLVTRTGAVIGTPQYMAPEQHRGAAVDHRTDLWAMGVIVYEMATGRLPYQDDSSERSSLTGPEIFHRMMTRPVVDPRYFHPSITEAFARATVMALQVDPSQRLPSARAFARMLADATPGDGYQPSGLELLRIHADELLEGDHRVETLQLPVPRIETAAQIAMPVPPISTLGAVASQSLPVAPSARSRRSWLIVGIGVAAAAAILSIVLARQDAATTTRQGEVAVHIPMPISAPVRDNADVAAVRVTDAGRPPVPGVAASTTSTAEAGLVDAPALAPHPQDAKLPDVPGVAVNTAPAADAGRIDAPALAAHPQGAGPPGTGIKAARVEPVATGTLQVVILPWAEVWVDGKALGQTPVRTKLSVGAHRVRLKNDAKEKTVTVTVTGAKLTMIDETW